MEKLEKEKNPLEALHEAIANSASAIEDEFARTQNNWLSCFGTRLFIIETQLLSKEVRKFFPDERTDLKHEYQKMASELEAIKEKLAKLKEQYPTKDTIPPIAVKRELLDELGIFKDRRHQIM